MANGKSKIEIEKRTVAAMIALYCRGKGHGVYSDVSASKTLSSKRTTSSSSPFLCPECSELLHYAHRRLERCRLGEEKPSCTRCPVHCYRKDMRERIRQVMRYSGPRMLLYDPIMAIRHLWDFLRSKFQGVGSNRNQRVL